MKAASDQPGGAGSVRPRNHQRSSARRSPSSAAVAHSGQSMHRSGEQASPHPPHRFAAHRPPGDRADPSEPAEEHLEQLAVAEPNNGAEEDHPDEGEHGVAGHDSAATVVATELPGRISSHQTPAANSTTAGQRARPGG